MNSIFKHDGRLTLITAGTLLVCGTAAQAQSTTSNAADGSAKLEEIVVTGSYFATASNQQGALEVVGADEINKSPKTSIAALLADLPSTQGNLITGGSNDNNNSPAQTINLRALGTRATLVLLNGQRQTATSEPVGGSDAFAVDLNSLVPSVMIERVEVLKDGASALYGSDAVAGVVNFITRKKIDGLIVQADGGTTGHGGRKNQRIGIAAGLDTGSTAVVAGVEYAHQDQILVTDIFDDPARIAKFGQQSAFSNPATFFPNGVPTPDPLCGSATIGGSPVAGLRTSTFCRQDLTQLRGMVAETDRAVGYTNIQHHFNDQLSLTTEFGAALVKMERYNSIGFPVTTAPLTVPASNPGNPFGNVPAYSVNYRSGSVFLNDKAVTKSSSNTYRARMNLDYEISDSWKLSFGGAYSTNRTSVVNGGYLNMQRLQDALNCVAGPSRNLCLNPFASSYLAAPGSPLYNTPAVLDWIRSPAMNDSDYALTTLDALLTGKLFEIGGRPVQLAFGAQRRQETTHNEHDLYLRTGGLSFGGAAPDYSLWRKVNSLFTEIQVPVLATVDVDIAVRMEDSNPGNRSVNPKLGLTWKPIEGLTFSGSVGKSERAPGLLQFTTQSVLGGIANDPVTNSPQNGFAVTLLPSTGLDPESSTNTNLGVNWQADLAGGKFGLNLDAWNIDFKKLITSTDITAFVLANPTSPQVQRNPVTRNILLVTVPGYRNANKMSLRGLDIDLSYRHSVGVGDLYTRVGGTLMSKYDFTNAAGVTSSYLGKFNTAVPPIAKTVLNVKVGFSTGSDDVSLTANYKSKLVETTAGIIGITEEKSFTTVDLAYQHSFSNGLSANFGVVNLLDKVPPGQGNSIYTTNSNAYPLTGRTFNIGVRKQF